MVFNRLWIYALLVCLLFGALARQPALTVVAILVLLAVGVSWLWTRAALRAVSYRRRLGATRLFRGETLTVECELVNLKPLPLAWIRVEDELPSQLETVGRRAVPASAPSSMLLSYLTSLRAYERVVWRSVLRCPRRGQFAVGPATLRSGDVFGFFSRSAEDECRDGFLVYPALVPLPELGIPPRRLFGDTRVPRALLVDPLRPVGVRDYRPEDSFRHIHWKATARAGELQVRVFEPTTVTQVGIFLNLDSGAQFWRGLEPQQCELAIGVAASLAAHAAAERRPFGVYSNRFVTGSHQMLRVPPGGGKDQLARALEGLARLSVFATREFADHLRIEARGLPWGSTVVVVTAIVPPGLAAALAGLRAAGRRVVLVATEPVAAPPVRGLVVHRVAAPSAEW